MKKVFHEFGTIMIDLSGTEQIITASGGCISKNGAWTDAPQNSLPHSTCSESYVFGNPNDYNGTYWLNSEG